MTSPTIDAKNPSFVVYLADSPAQDKLRIRFGQSAKMMAIIQVKAGEAEGAYEAKLAAVPATPGAFAATYSGTLASASYVVYTLTDASTGGEAAWERSKFQYAGGFTVK
jgi:hypothetical protein